MRANIDTSEAFRKEGRSLVTDRRAEPVADVMVSNDGSVFTFRPISAKAKAWIEEHVEEDAQYLGSALAVEARYAMDLCDGLMDAGLTLG